MNNIYHSFSLNTNMKSKEWYFSCKNENEQDWMSMNKINCTWMRADDFYSTRTRANYILICTFSRFKEKSAINDRKWMWKYHLWLSMTNITHSHLPIHEQSGTSFSETISSQFMPRSVPSCPAHFLSNGNLVHACSVCLMSLGREY